MTERGQPDEAERDKVVTDMIETIINRHHAQPYPPDYWRDRMQQEARIRARLVAREAQIIGRREVPHER